MKYCYEQLIDWTTFRTVRQFLRQGKAIQGVVFVNSEELLSEVAYLLDESPLPLQLRKLRWNLLVKSRQVVPGGDCAQEQSGTAVDIEEIPDSAACQVIHFPPLYLVYLPTLELRSPRPRAECSMEDATIRNSVW